MPTNNIIDRTDTGTGTGTLVPDAERREILKSLPAASTVLALARTVNMSTKVEKQPVLSTLPSAYWVNGDTGLKQTTEAQWANKTITAEELAVIVPVPENLLADSAYDIFGELRPEIVAALGVKLDQAVLFGTDKPASFETAVTDAAIAAGNTINVSATGDDASDISSVMGKVEEDGFEVSGFAARMRLKGRLRNLRDTSGAPIYSPSLTSGTPASLWGENIVYSDANGAWRTEGIDLIAGDWSKLVVGVRQDITFKLFTEGVITNDAGAVVLNLMQQDSVALRVVARYGFTVANPINRMNQVAATRYPFAILETAEGS